RISSSCVALINILFIVSDSHFAATTQPKGHLRVQT
ncbi:MAG: hypothetical protein ACI8U1_002791, partial [Rheinheimera aquimaris]